MSLKKAIEAVIAAMDHDAKVMAESPDKMYQAAGVVLTGYANQLLVACLAASDEGGLRPEEYLSREELAEQRVRDAQRSARAAEIGRKAELEEGLGERTVVLVDEDLSEYYVSVSAQMPPGAYTQIGGSVYQLGADGKLYFHAGQTAKLRGEPEVPVSTAPKLDLPAG